MDVLQDRKSNGEVVNYVNSLGIDNKLKITTGTTSKYFLADHLGSTTGLADSNGVVTESASYDSFGRTISSNLTTRYQYTGREYDEYTGLMFYRARFYDPQIGRFISEDPIGFAGGINLFDYVKSNPVLYRDPTGLRRCHPLVGAIVGGIIGATIGAVGGAVVGPVVGGVIGGAIGGSVGGTVGLAGGPVGSVTLGGAGSVGGAATGAAVGVIVGPIIGGVGGGILGSYIGERICSGGESTCDSTPKAVPIPYPTPRPFPPLNEPKRTCKLNGSFINAATGKKHCIYSCRGGGFPGGYLIGSIVEPNHDCPEPDKNDNDWVPGGF